VELLFQLSDKFLDAGLYQPEAGAGQKPKAAPAVTKSTWKGVARPENPALAPSATPPPTSLPPPGGLTTPIYLARDGVVLFEGVDDAKMLSLIQSKEIVGIDHYYRHGMADWLLVSYYANLAGLML
jgi:hypothetical protein